MSACGAELGLISIEQALALISDHTEALAIEQLALKQALHRYLAVDIYSSIDLPLFAQSAVDGYALCTRDVVACGSQFALLGEIKAGQMSELCLEQGQAVRIFTGAQIPKGTTTIARQEVVQTLPNQKIGITENLKRHADMRDQGEEVTVGQCLAQRGQQLSVGAIAALSMAGVQQVQVFQYPKIAVVITGDEVAEQVEDLASGKIFDANAPLIQAWFQQHHQRVKIFHVADTEHAVKILLHDLAKDYDVIISTGGVSVGDYDFIRPVALQLGFEQVFWKVKQKPGKPMFFAIQERPQQSPCYFLGLPGNPAAVYVGMQIYTTTLIQALQGQNHDLKWFNAILSHDLKADARDRFLRMSAQFEQATLTVKSLSKQQSHMLSNLMQANCLVRIAAGQVPKAGQMVQGVFI